MAKPGALLQRDPRYDYSERQVCVMSCALGPVETAVDVSSILTLSSHHLAARSVSMSGKKSSSTILEYWKLRFPAERPRDGPYFFPLWNFDIHRKARKRYTTNMTAMTAIFTHLLFEMKSKLFTTDTPSTSFGKGGNEFGVAA